jgi:tetratricopeptide (TPR) repeat protein
MVLAFVHIAQGEYRQCIDIAEKVLSVEPGYVPVLSLAGAAEFQLGDYAEAQRYYQRVMSVDSASGRTSLGCIYWKTGRKNEARELFARSLKYDERELAQGNEWSDLPYDVARINALLGNKAEAYKWLQKAVDAGWIDYRSAETDLFFDNLREDDTFKHMLADLKARVEEMRKRVEETDEE